MKKTLATSTDTTFISKIDDALYKPIPQLVEMAKESTSLSRIILRNRMILEEIAANQNLSLWRFIHTISHLDEMLAIEIFRSTNRDLYLHAAAFKDIREICLYHDDDLRVCLAIFSEVIKLPAIDHVKFFMQFFRYILEQHISRHHFTTNLAQAFSRTVILNIDEALATVNALRSSLSLLDYKKNALKKKQEELIELIGETQRFLKSKFSSFPPYLKLPHTMIARIRFQHVYEFNEDVQMACAYTEAIYSEECVWAQLVEEDFQPVVLATMSYFEYYGRKTWVERTLKQLKADTQTETTGYDREKVIEDVIDTLRILYMQGDHEAGIEYLKLAGAPYYQNCTSQKLYPINRSVGLYLLELLKNSYKDTNRINELEANVLALEKDPRDDIKVSKKLRSQFFKEQKYESNQTWNGRVSNIMKF